jgi:ketosteroid isomerase-like protein
MFGGPCTSPPTPSAVIAPTERRPRARCQARCLAIALLLVATPALVRAQEPGSDRDSVVAEIIRLDSLWLNAYVTRDVEAVRGILADDFRGQTRDTPVDKADILRGVAESATTSMTLERITVSTFGDIAAAHAIRHSTDRTSDGASTETRFAYTDVYRWQDGRWVCITGQSAALPPAS